MELGLRVLPGLRVLRGSWPQSQGTVMERFDLVVHLQAMHVGCDSKIAIDFGSVAGPFSGMYIYICTGANRNFCFFALFENLHKI